MEATRSSMRRWLRSGGPKPTALALAAMIAMSVLTACGGDEEKKVSPELATRLQQVLDRAVESPKTFFPGTALYVSLPEQGTWAAPRVRATSTRQRP